MKTIDSKIKKIILKCDETINIESISKDSNLIYDFSFNSIKMIRLICEIEETFDIEINDEYLEIQTLSSFENLSDIVTKIIMEKDNVN